MRTRSRLAVPALLLAALLPGAALAGCADQPGTESASSGTSVPSESGDDAPTTAPQSGGSDDEAPPFPGDVSEDTATASADARVTVRDIRIGRHDGYDRVVFEVGGTGTPGWSVGYVEEASSQGSGNPVEVAGDAVLRVSLTGAGYPYDTGVEEYAGPDPLSTAGTEVVTEVAFDNTFEGTTVAFVGTRAEAPFRVYLLADPVRVVVEVADPS